MKKSIKNLIAISLSAVMAISLVGCGKNQSAKQETIDVTIDSIKLGEDYTDITADLKFITHRTDSIDTKFNDYIAEFNQLYPNISITYEGITDYANGITTRLSTGDWGDICMIPTTIDKNELSNYFIPFGDLATLSNNYDMLNNFTYENVVYGIPSVGNAQGVVYNKRIFEEAGITEIPKMPDEFLDALQKIKDNTDAIPLYTNFAADWTMTAWDAYISGTANGSPDYTNEGLVKGENPFSDRGDQTGPFAVYNVLYEAVKRGLTEDDPTTTDWEGSKGMMNKGEIGTMVLGSWAVTQIQDAGENADDIAYMSFPITVNGKQYATAAPDYCYGININSTADEKIAAMIYIKWLVEESGFAQSEGSISVVKGDALPDSLKEFEGIELVVDNPALEGEENLFADINNESELGINVSGAISKQVIEEAISGTKTMEEMADEWNQAWSKAQEANGVTPK